MTVWYNPISNELAIKLDHWWLWEIEHLVGYLHFIPKRPWIELGEL